MESIEILAVVESVSNEKGIEEGAELVVGGLGKPEGLTTGYYVKPTVFAGVSNDMAIAREEIFGPVACAIPFKSFDEVLKSANNTPFGLSAVLWTQNLSRALQFVEEIEAGFVQVNQCVAPRANVSYGGLKMSGLGKEYAFDSMINHFTQSKTVLINRGNSNIDE